MPHSLAMFDSRGQNEIGDSSAEMAMYPPLVIRTDMRIKFAERDQERLCDIQNQKNRATRSLDMSIRRTPSSTATVEERERSLNLRAEKKQYLQSAVDGVVKKLRGDASDSCV